MGILGFLAMILMYIFFGIFGLMAIGFIFGVLTGKVFNQNHSDDSNS